MSSKTVYVGTCIHAV